MSSTKTMYLQTILFLLLKSSSSFIVRPTIATTKQKLVQSTRYLHVDPIHIHRDSLLRLDDPMLLGKETDHTNTKYKHPLDYPWDTKQIHKFTNSIAPFVLGLYLIGYYLSQHQHQDVLNSNSLTMDPMFGGGILIGVGLIMIKWSVDRTFLSPF